MSKRGYISRFLLILKKVKSKPYCTLEELQAYIEEQVEYMRLTDDTLEVGYSARTLQRDLREIKNCFGIEVKYARREKGYIIDKSGTENMNFQRRMEAFDLFHSLNMADELLPYVQLEKRRPQGTEHLHEFIEAIKMRREVKFNYQKFWEDAITERQVAPYALKEFNSRWYIVAKENISSLIKTFALDRVTNLEITTHHFVYPESYNVENEFRNYFGIISPRNESPQEILLSFVPIQGKYVKSLPLHESQKVIADTEDEVIVKLELCVTYDFIMELLSFSDNMKVLQPIALANAVKAAHQAAFIQY